MQPGLVRMCSVWYIPILNVNVYSCTSHNIMCKFWVQPRGMVLMIQRCCDVIVIKQLALTVIGQLDPNAAGNCSNQILIRAIIYRTCIQVPTASAQVEMVQENVSEQLLPRNVMMTCLVYNPIGVSLITGIWTGTV